MTAANILKIIKEKEVDYVDLRFTDVKGKLQHMTQDISTIDEDFLNNGTFFDGSSIAGWKAINESDMVLKPDLSRAFIDPFTSHNTLVIFCDIMDPIKNDYYERDPRSIAKKAGFELDNFPTGNQNQYSDKGCQNDQRHRNTVDTEIVIHPELRHPSSFFDKLHRSC